MTENSNQTITVQNEKDQEILRSRAQALAREPEKAIDEKELLEVIAFRLGGEMYGLEAAFVREVYPLKDFTPLPGVPAFVLGIINVRGQILSVIDLKKFFELPEKGLGQLNKVIILRDDCMEFGILADEIVGNRVVVKKSIQKSIPTISGIGASYLKGVTQEHFIILDAKQILGDKTIIVHQETE